MNGHHAQIGIALLGVTMVLGGHPTSKIGSNLSCEPALTSAMLLTSLSIQSTKGRIYWSEKLDSPPFDFDKMELVLYNGTRPIGVEGAFLVDGKTYDSFLPLTEVASITILSAAQNKGFNALIGRRDGKTIEVRSAVFRMKGTEAITRLSAIQYYYDPVTGKHEEKAQRLVTKDFTQYVARIVFTESPGEVKRCAADGFYFPETYAYCPFDKVPLQWAKVGDPEKATPIKCNACERVYFDDSWEFCPFDGERLPE